jgi:hypothetical protein
MSCDAVQKLIPLYYYGELTPEEEDFVEGHVFECAACAHATERQRSLAAALDRRQVEPPAELLQECRTGLISALHGSAPISQPKTKSPWALFLDAVAASLAGFGRFRQPLTAAAMLMLGFGLAHFPDWRGPLSQAVVVPNQAFATVRSVLTDPSGRVQIAFDQTERRVISGRMDDQGIRKLLMAGAHDQDPDVRVQSVDLLKDRAASAEVREALVNRLESDPNPGVRLKALEGLKPLAGDPEVRKTLAQVLLADDNPAVRLQVVDLLVTHRDDSMVGVFQHLVQKEDNNYVRLQCEKALKEMNASVGTF